MKTLTEIMESNNLSIYKAKFKLTKEQIDEIENFMIEPMDFFQKLYHFYFETKDIPKCKNPNCNKTSIFKNKKKGYLETCSKSCGIKMCDLVEKDRKLKQTKLERYGNENYCNTEKNKQTKLERYGDENYNNREKFRKTNLELYGFEHSSQNEMIKQKTTRAFKDGVLLRNIDRLSEDYIILDILNDYDFKLKCKNCTCGKEPFIANKYFMFSRGLCLNKFPKHKSSYEIIIKDFIDTLDIDGELLINKRPFGTYEIDFYLPNYKFGIEFNGDYWHDEKQKGKYYHLNKTEFFKSKGIDILHIWEFEWVKNQHYYENLIKNRLGFNQFIRTNNVKIKKIRTIDFSNFHKEKISSKIKMGLYVDNVLYSIMGMTKYEFHYKLDFHFDLYGTSVENSFNLLLNCFIEEYSIKVLFTELDFSCENINKFKDFELMYQTDVKLLDNDRFDIHDCGKLKFLKLF